MGNHRRDRPERKGLGPGEGDGLVPCLGKTITRSGPSRDLKRGTVPHGTNVGLRGKKKETTGATHTRAASSGQQLVGVVTSRERGGSRFYVTTPMSNFYGIGYSKTAAPINSVASSSVYGWHPVLAVVVRGAISLSKRHSGLTQILVPVFAPLEFFARTHSGSIPRKRYHPCGGRI